MGLKRPNRDSISKYAMEAFADTLRRELRPFGIAVALLEPGVVTSEIWRRSLADADHRLAQGPDEQTHLYGPLIDRVRAQALHDAAHGTPADRIAADILHALSAPRPRARYVSGRGARVKRLLARLPDRWVDALLRRALRW